MSRTEELRNRLRSRTFDKNFSDFNVDLEKFLKEKRNASASSSNFSKKIYDEYRRSGASNATEWITERLEQSFVSETMLPLWADEPDWCFCEDEPMVFVGQIADKLGVSLYIFKAGYDSGDGVQDIYRMLAQDKEGKIHLDGDIRG